MTRPGFDTSPLLRAEVNKAILQMSSDELHSESLVHHNIKTINKTPSSLMILKAKHFTGLSEQQIRDVWDQMWEFA